MAIAATDMRLSDICLGKGAKRANLDAPPNAKDARVHPGGQDHVWTGIRSVDPRDRAVPAIA